MRVSLWAVLAAFLPFLSVGAGALLGVHGFKASSLLVTVILLGTSSLVISASTAGDDYASLIGAICLWSVSLSSWGWFYLWWMPLLVFVTLSCFCLGATSRNLPQHQDLRHLFSAAVAILTLGLLGRMHDFGDQVV